MAEDWRRILRERLRGEVNNSGAWGYRSDCTGAAEPTALAALALASGGEYDQHCRRALNWLSQLQNDVGAVPVSAEVSSPQWPTALALLAWIGCDSSSRRLHRSQIERAHAWLLQARGRSISRKPSILDDDTTLVGWPWIEGSHSWLEPSGYAILALRSVGSSDHPRVREAVRLIFDRALPSGGWNYGNRRVFGKTLRPFAATTGIALAALAGEPADACVTSALDYLSAELPHIRAPLSLAWSLIGMRSWDAMPSQADAYLETAADRLISRPAMPHYMAMLLLAGAERCLPVDVLEAQGHD